MMQEFVLVFPAYMQRQNIMNAQNVRVRGAGMHMFTIYVHIVLAAILQKNAGSVD